MRNGKYTGAQTLVPQLQETYRKYGYRKFKMNRFEEYDLYVQNKNFLVCDNVITFNDTNGKLMALKPDVTLSIVKNSSGIGLDKVYYNENVYRVSSRTHEFKELTQVGLECIGNVDEYVMSEVVLLAQMSLECISDEYILDVSHVGIISELLDKIGCEESQRPELYRLVESKNSDGIIAYCNSIGINPDISKRIAKLSSVYGPFETVFPELCSLCGGRTAALDQLESIYLTLKTLGKSEKINIDPSMVNDISYYNGVIFQGFIQGVPSAVISGGRYDKLLLRFNKTGGAIGFAVYVDMLEYLDAEAEKNDVDVAVKYSSNTPPALVAKTVQSLRNEGKSVVAVTGNVDIRCENTIDITAEGIKNA